MATEVYSTLEAKLRDGTEVEFVPLGLGDLRKFMKRWNEFQSWLREESKKEVDKRADDDAVGDKQFDCFLDLLELCLTEYRDSKSDEEYRKWIERAVDEHTAIAALNKCGGLGIGEGDPNQMNPEMAPGAGTN